LVEGVWHPESDGFHQGSGFVLGLLLIRAPTELTVMAAPELGCNAARHQQLSIIQCISLPARCRRAAAFSGTGRPKFFGADGKISRGHRH
jgi:hypothetical protein